MNVMPSLLKRVVYYAACCVLLGVMASHGAGGTNAPASRAKEVKEPPKPIEIAKSTFAQPRNPKEGRDPFYPSSDYPFQQGSVRPVDRTSGTVSDLKLTGIGGTPGNRVANINNRACVKGEDVEMTVNGVRMQFHVEDITEDSVILKINGEEKVLRFRKQF